MNTVHERLRRFIKEMGMSVRQFEKSIGVSNGYVKGVGKNIGSEIMTTILDCYPELNDYWLLTGKGNMLNEGSEIKVVKAVKGDGGIPLIPFEAVAGFSLVDNEGVNFDDCEKYIVPEFQRKGVQFLVRVSGSSMYPKYSNGDILGCMKIENILFFQWGKIYVLDTSQGVMVKRVYESDNKDNIKCVSDNRDTYPPFDLPKSDIRSLSIVIGCIRLD